MSKHSLYFILVLLTALVSSPQEGLAQTKAQIANVDFFVRNDTMYVTYDLLKTKSNEWFDVTMTVKTMSGRVLFPVSLSGHAGKFVAGGKRKQISWAIAKDNMFIDEEIFIELRALPMAGQQAQTPVVEKEPEYAAQKPREYTTITYSKGGAIALSAILPGMGITKQKEGGPYWLMGMATYGLVAGGVILNISANSKYNKYQEATTAADRDAFYSSAVSQKNTGKILFFAAAGVWVGSIVWTILTPNKIKSTFSFYPTYNPTTNNVMISMSVKL
ncbi:hypothetical protein ACFLS7_05830 [Bacteroidota bacterium]